MMPAMPARQAGHLRAVRQFPVELPHADPPDGDGRALRAVFGQFATGITVVTSAGAAAHGMTANSFSSVSLDPPLVLVCIDRGALMHDTIVANEAFAVSMLGAGQEHVARHFASKGRVAGTAQFDAVDWIPGEHTGAPLMVGALAWLECRLSQVYEGGDHSIFLGEVLGLGRSTGDEALLYFGGGYHQVLSNHIA